MREAKPELWWPTYSFLTGLRWVREAGSWRCTGRIFLMLCLSPFNGTPLQYSCLENSPEKEMVTHSTILAWKIPWTEECMLQSLASQKDMNVWPILTVLNIFTLLYKRSPEHFHFAKLKFYNSIMFFHSGFNILQFHQQCARVQISPHPTPLGHHRALHGASCVIQQLLTSYLFYTW